MILGVMAIAGMPGMAGFISEFLVFRGSLTAFPVATLLCMVGSGLTAVYFLLLVNRAFFGRLAVTQPSGTSPSFRVFRHGGSVRSRLAVHNTIVSPASISTLAAAVFTNSRWIRTGRN